MIRRPPRSTLFPYHDALPISSLPRGGRVLRAPDTAAALPARDLPGGADGRCQDRKSTRLNSSHLVISYAVFCLKKKINMYYYFLLYHATFWTYPISPNLSTTP